MRDEKHYRPVKAKPPSNTLRFAVKAGLLALAAAHAFAADADENRKVETVVVIGTTPLPGADTDASKIPGAIQSASGADIDRAHVADVASFMNRALGGVYINEVQNNSLQPDVNYRGFTASPLLGTPQGLSVYLDGVRLNQPFGDVVSWDLIPRAAIESLTLMPGSNPVFGLNTLGGALSIHSKDGWSDPGTSIEVAYGSYRSRRVELETGGHSQELYWYATGNVQKNDGWRNDSATDAAQAFGKVGWRDEASDIFLSGAYAHTDLTGNGLQEQRLLAQDYAGVYTKPDNTINHASLVNLVARQAFSDFVTISGNAYYRNIETATLNGDVNENSLGENVYQPTAAEQAALLAAGYQGFPTSGENAVNTPFPFWRCIANVVLNSEPNEKCNGLVNRTRTSQHEYGAGGQLTLRESVADHEHQFTLGATFVRSDAHFTQAAQFGYVLPDRGIATVDGPGAFADGTQDSESAFDARVDLSGATTMKSIYALNKVEITQKLELSVSGRYDRTSVANVDALTPSGTPGSLSGDHRFSRFNPAAALSFALLEDVSAYLNYSEGSRAPSAIELGCADPQNPCKLPNAMSGDPPLEQVVTKTMEAGVRGHRDTFTWNAALFRADNTNDILFVADNAAGFGYFKNFGKTQRQGFEVGLQDKFGSVSIGAHYTFLDATYRSAEIINANGNSSNDAIAPGFEGNIHVRSGDRIPLIPKHVLKSFARWEPADAWSFNVDMQLIGDSIARGNENNAHQADGVYYLGPGKIGGFTLFNIGVEYRAIERLKVYAQLDNVFDRRYYTAAQLGVTAFTANGAFVSRPFSSPVVGGERPLQYATFYAPGAPRSVQVGLRYSF